MSQTKNRVLKTAFRVWLRLVFATVLCAIVFASVYALGTAAFSEVVGYRIYQTDESGENQVLISEHIYTDEEDKTKEIPLDSNQILLRLRETPDSASTAMAVVSSAIMLLIYGLFPYNILWAMGDREENNVQYKHISYDPWLGLKVGLVTMIPSAIMYLLLILGKYKLFPDVIIKWHRLLNTPFIPYIDAVENGAAAASELSVASLLAVGVILLFVPAISALGYHLGYRHISVREKLIYKKTPTRSK